MDQHPIQWLICWDSIHWELHGLLRDFPYHGLALWWLADGRDHTQPIPIRHSQPIPRAFRGYDSQHRVGLRPTRGDLRHATGREPPCDAGSTAVCEECGLVDPSGHLGDCLHCCDHQPDEGLDAFHPHASHPAPSAYAPAPPHAELWPCASRGPSWNHACELQPRRYPTPTFNCLCVPLRRVRIITIIPPLNLLSSTVLMCIGRW